MLECWYLALHSRYGVVLQCVGDPAAVRNKLYVERRKAKDPALENIVMMVSPEDPTQLWLVKKDHEAEVGPPTAESDT